MCVCVRVCVCVCVFKGQCEFILRSSLCYIAEAYFRLTLFAFNASTLKSSRMLGNSCIANLQLSKIISERLIRKKTSEILEIFRQYFVFMKW